MAELTDEILDYLSKHDALNSLEYGEARQLDHQKVIGAIKSLQSQSIDNVS